MKENATILDVFDWMGRDTFEFNCPFCRTRVGMTFSECKLEHSEPTCETFRDLEPDEFLHQCNTTFMSIARAQGSEAARQWFCREQPPRLPSIPFRNPPA